MAYFSPRPRGSPHSAPSSPAQWRSVRGSAAARRAHCAWREAASAAELRERRRPAGLNFIHGALISEQMRGLESTSRSLEHTIIPLLGDDEPQSASRNSSLADDDQLLDAYSRSV